jgi:cytoskeletal protein RodZ
MGTQITRDPNSTPRWLLPVALALLVAIIIAAGFFATHRHILSAASTDTPTPTPKVIKKVVTATPSSRSGHTPTPTPNAGQTSTPNPNPGNSGGSGNGSTPTPSPIPRPSPTPTPDYGVKLGQIPHTKTQLDTIQQGANRNESQYTLTLDPFREVRASLPTYGFKTVTIVSPQPETNSTPNPTPTPYTGPNNLPTVKITVAYQGHRFIVTLQQPVQQGPKGIWAVISIQVVPTS